MFYYRFKQYEKTLFWNDKHVNIKWPIKKPTLSVKDKNGLSLNSFILMDIYMTTQKSYSQYFLLLVLDII